MKRTTLADLFDGDRYAVAYIAQRARRVVWLRIGCFMATFVLAMFSGSAMLLVLLAGFVVWNLVEPQLLERGVRRDLVRSEGRMCTHCAHDLRGLEDRGVCPECGKEFDVEADRRRWHEDMPRTIMRDGTPFTREKWEARWKVERPGGGKRAEVDGVGPGEQPPRK